VAPVLLALTLATAPQLWVATQGLDDLACDSASLAAAIHAQRPGAVVHTEMSSERPPPSAIHVRLSRGPAGTTVLEVTGLGLPLLRTLPSSDGCQRDVAIAALIVDGALDDLRASEGAPTVDSLASLRSLIQASVALGAGFEQGPAGPVASLDVSGAFRYRFFEITLDADVGLPSSTQLTETSTNTGPETTSQQTQPLKFTTLALELGLGVAPHLGPGRLSADAVLGTSIAFSSSTGSSASLFQQASPTSSAFFAGLRVGYVFDLPRGFFIGARAEERFAPVTTTFQLVDTPTSTNNPSVSTLTWTFEAVGLVGVRFF